MISFPDLFIWGTTALTSLKYLSVCMPSWAQAKVWDSCCELFSPFLLPANIEEAEGCDRTPLGQGWSSTRNSGLDSISSCSMLFFQISIYFTLLYYIFRDSSEHHRSLKIDLFCRFWATVSFHVSWVTGWCGSSSGWARKMLPVRSCGDLLLKSKSDFVCVFWGASKWHSLTCNTAKQFPDFVGSIMVCLESSGASDNLYSVVVKMK